MKRKYYLYEFMKDFMPIYPLYSLLFQSKGLSVQEISMLFTIWTLPVILLEIPSGILADRWSRKNMILLGSILNLFAFLSWFFSNGFFMYALGFILWGIGSSCCSGSKEALLYDTLKQNDKEDEFEKIYSTGEFISSVAHIVACILGGILAQTSKLELPLLISIGSCFVLTLISVTFKECNLSKHTQSNANLFGSIKNDVKFFCKKRMIVFVLLFLVIVGTSESLDEYDQLIVHDFGYTYAMIGIWSGIRFTFEGIGSLITPMVHRWMNRIFSLHNEITLILILGIFSSILLGLCTLVHQTIAIVLYALYYFIISITRIITESYLQKQIEGEERSTIHSIVSLLLNFYGMFIFMILGQLSFTVGLFSSLGIISILMVIMMMTLYILCKYVGKSGNQN